LNNFKVTEIGIVYNPVLGQKFTARRGQGAFHNGQQIYVSGEKELSKALLTTEFGTSREEEKTKIVLENITKLVKMAHGFRSLGAAALNICM
jgi:myo-inositol-1(or 4)-monophosphatase